MGWMFSYEDPQKRKYPQVGSSLVAQSCQTLCDTMDCSPPSFSVYGISQARILEWVAISYSRASSQPKGSNPHLLHLLLGRQILYHWATWKAHKGAKSGMKSVMIFVSSSDHFLTQKLQILHPTLSRDVLYPTQIKDHQPLPHYFRCLDPLPPRQPF